MQVLACLCICFGPLVVGFSSLRECSASDSHLVVLSTSRHRVKYDRLMTSLPSQFGLDPISDTQLSGPLPGFSMVAQGYPTPDARAIAPEPATFQQLPSAYPPVTTGVHAAHFFCLWHRYQLPWRIRHLIRSRTGTLRCQNPPCDRLRHLIHFSSRCSSPLP